MGQDCSGVREGRICSIYLKYVYSLDAVKIVLIERLYLLASNDALDFQT